MPGIVYLDSSALTKLVISERSSAALMAHLEGKSAVSSSIARVEVLRAVRRSSGSPAEIARAERVLERLGSVKVGPAVLDRAAHLEPPALRSLDAIHLASALEIGDRLTAFITYDRQLGAAAARAGLTVEVPGVD